MTEIKITTYDIMYERKREFGLPSCLFDQSMFLQMGQQSYGRSHTVLFRWPPHVSTLHRGHRRKLQGQGTFGLGFRF